MVSTTTAVVIGLAVGVAFIFVVAGASTYLPQESCIPLANVDIIPFQLDRSVRLSEFIVVGEVVHVQSRVITYDFVVTRGDDEIARNERAERFTFVTLNVEKYLKDSTGRQSPQLTFRDYWMASCYDFGDKAVFFIGAAGENLQMYGYVSKFDINEIDGSVQSMYFADIGKPAQRLVDFENTIAILATQSPTELQQ